jgi:quaternary ammonium compound-resistance protein SugE
MAWMILFLAGILETCWTVGLKYSDGFTKFWPSVITVSLNILSVYLLSVAMRTLEMGTSYAVWVGIGAAGAAVFGVLLFNESLKPERMFFLALLLVAIVGLKYTAHN